MKNVPEPADNGPRFIYSAFGLLGLFLAARYAAWLIIVAIVAVIVWLCGKHFVLPASAQLARAWPQAMRSMQRGSARWTRAYWRLDELPPIWLVLGCIGLAGVGISIPLFLVPRTAMVQLAHVLFSASAALLGVVQFVPRISAVTQWALAAPSRRYPFVIVATAIAFVANSKARDMAAAATGEDPAAFVTFLGFGTVLITPLVYVSVIASALCVWSTMELVAICLLAAVRFLMGELSRALDASPWRNTRRVVRMRRRTSLRRRLATSRRGLRVPYLLRPACMMFFAIMLITGSSRVTTWLEHVSRAWSDRVLVLMDFHPTEVCDRGREPLAVKITSDRFVVATVMKGEVFFRTVTCPGTVSNTPPTIAAMVSAGTNSTTISVSR